MEGKILRIAQNDLCSVRLDKLTEVTMDAPIEILEFSDYL